MYKHILVPTDGSPLSLKAVKEAAALAKRLGSKVTTLYVSAMFMPPIVYEGMRPGEMDQMQEAFAKSTKAAAERALDKAGAPLRAAKVPTEARHVTHDRPWEAIIAAAKKQRCDLIVMASHGHRGLKGLLLGSETVKVLTHSKTPVLVCR